MPTTLRLATFNCENLFARFKFKSNVDKTKASTDGFTVNELAFDFLNADEKALTAKAIKEAAADVIALMEVDNLDVLKRFRNKHLNAMGYTEALLIDGNDPRHIDVAVLGKFPLRSRSYQHLKSGGSSIFSRDCLEVDVDVNGKTLTLFVNHLKSMLDKTDPKNGRKNTRAKRVLQSKTVKSIVTDRFGTNAGQASFAIVGDLNDYRDPTEPVGTDGISEIVGWSQVENVVDRIADPALRWTHFYDQTKALNAKPEAYRQLDYILLSKSLAAKTAAVPEIVRKGICKRAVLNTVARFPGVGEAKPAASDHCPVVIEIKV